MLEFQFHKGTIKTHRRWCTHYQGVRFNSIKVRLKRCILWAGVAGVAFQFHKGTIKTNSLHYDSEAKRSFNSIKVRLKL